MAEYNAREGRLQKHIRATIAEFEREKIKERMTRGKRNKVKTGSMMIARYTPHGYQIRKDAKKVALEAIDEKAAVTRMIFDRGIITCGDYGHKVVGRAYS